VCACGTKRLRIRKKKKEKRMRDGGVCGCGCVYMLWERGWDEDREYALWKKGKKEGFVIILSWSHTLLYHALYPWIV
jgi:hypothetical protein